VLSSGVSAIAQAEVTKQAREMPIVRRIGIASFKLAPLAAGNAISLSHANKIGWARECRSVSARIVPDESEHDRQEP
jgi:hypothetical protein